MLRYVTRRNILIAVCVFVVLVYVALYFRTGIFQSGSVDERDLDYWNYTSEGIIVGAEEFTIPGDKNTCWLLVHGFAATPAEMRVLGEKINEEFGDYVYAPRLSGHGEVPGELIGKNFSIWYSEVEQDFEGLIEQGCGEVNVVGSSMGGQLIVKLAEEKEVGRIYALNTYLFSDWWKERLMGLAGRVLGYSKKTQLAQINDPSGLDEHITYWNFAYTPILDSRGFTYGVIGNLEKIDEPILIQHGLDDRTASLEGAELIYDEVSSDEKELVVLERSNHIILLDFEREEVMQNIIKFEKSFR